MAGAPNCDLLHIPGLPDGAMQKACINTNKSLGYDAQGNKIAGAAPPSSQGSSILGIPLPGSDWLRHMMFRAGEVIIGIAMIIVGIKAFVSSSDTTKVIVSGAKKVGKNL